MDTKKIQDNLYQIREHARESASHIGHDDPELVWEELAQAEKLIIEIRTELENCKVAKTQNVKAQLERLKRMQEEEGDNQG